MTIHKEGYKILLTALLIAGIIITLFFIFINNLWLKWILTAFVMTDYFLVVLFFRYPRRPINYERHNVVTAPADGKIVAIEEVTETEYFNDKRIQVSIFMSPFNVHVNRYPVSGRVKYVKYHPGKYLCAWMPKSSLENERNTVVIESNNGTDILVRQIAGVVARRIVCYSQTGDIVKHGNDLGFIKFGSRVDIFLPAGAPVKVKMGDCVKGNITVISELH
ncbi:MAG: phosphatidylserine decarboxylase [Bacteroidetes bacterium ADurb.Bin408]|nr:MAG: phosphatidylserine decarboxylase [Bacteroidetes bacterium ADurb.Bin408]